ncbi:DUF5677 domain-containing protein [Candidatus Nanosalina sp. VS9-1]|uniref:DUF5677 domain-containing protein n=1 Tax=Candidatus Nanosalina sp. VS9-1 TaxID=3388566 RepID=UPI0039E01041
MSEEALRPRLPLLPKNESFLLDISIMEERDEWFYNALEESLEEAGRDLTQEEINELAEDTAEELSEDLKENILDLNEELEQHKSEMADFRDQLKDHWGTPLDLLQNFILCSRDIGNGINMDNRLEAAEEQDYKFEALVQIHARGVQVASEILALLEAGYADGSMARWRTLHELSCNANVIADNGQNTAQRYLEQSIILDFYLAEKYREYQDELDFEPIDSETWQDLKEQKEMISDKFEDIDGYRGTEWAKNALEEGHVSIKNLEESAGLEMYEPFRKLGNHTVHADSRGTMNKLGMINLPDAPERPSILAGPSNGGLDRPGQLTAIALQQINLALVESFPTATDSITLRAMDLIVDDICEEFSSKAEKLAEKERESLEEWSNMDIAEIAEEYVGLEEILTDEFFQELTAWQGRTDFLESMPEHEKIETIELDNSSNLDTQIASESEFKSLYDLVDRAFEKWAKESLEDMK